MLEEQVSELDEMSMSALAELCNMILGNTATIFSKNDIHIDITPPTVLTGDNLQLAPTKGVVVCIPILLEEVSMDLDIAYIED